MGHIGCSPRAAIARPGSNGRAASAGPAITPSDRCHRAYGTSCAFRAGERLHTRSTKTTIRIAINFEIAPLNREPPYGIEP
jgi:hypothetical protein